MPLDQSYYEDEQPHAVREENGRIIYMEDEIMEMMIGRKLLENERVIHKNGNTLDNRRENLLLVDLL